MNARGRNPVPTVEENGGGVLVTIQRKTVEDIIAGREESGGVNGGVNGAVNGDSNGCYSDGINDCNKGVGAVNGAVNNEFGAVNSDR